MHAQCGHPVRSIALPRQLTTPLACPRPCLPWLQGVRVVLTDGAAHAVDSSELAFKLASMFAFRWGWVGRCCHVGPARPTRPACLPACCRASRLLPVMPLSLMALVYPAPGAPCRQGYDKAAPTIMEPIMNVEVGVVWLGVEEWSVWPQSVGRLGRVGFGWVGSVAIPQGSAPPAPPAPSQLPPLPAPPPRPPLHAACRRSPPPLSSRATSSGM